MNELIEASLRFPTVVFTIGLGIALIYWLFVLLGALDIDLLGGGDGGGIDLNGDGIPDIAIGKGAVQGDHDVGGEGLLAKLGLGVVPLTITVSLILLVGWVGSLLVMNYAGHIAAVKYTLLPGMLIGGILVTSVLVRPLAPVFRIREGKSNREYVGHTCTITTGSVDERFGQASIEDAGITLDIPVRCDAAAKLARGEKALIIDFDEARQAYVVEPVASILPGPSGDGRTSDETAS